jgi:hypothetical protein
MADRTAPAELSSLCDVLSLLLSVKHLPGHAPDLEDAKDVVVVAVGDK